MKKKTRMCWLRFYVYNDKKCDPSTQKLIGRACIIFLYICVKIYKNDNNIRQHRIGDGQGSNGYH